MKSLNTIEQELAPILQQLEQASLEQHTKVSAAQKWMLLPILDIFIAIGLAFAGYTTPAMIVGGMGALALLVFIIFLQSAKKDHQRNLKMSLVPRFAKALYPNIRYNPNQSIAKKLVAASNIFGEFSNCRGEDFFTGRTASGTAFQFSELVVTHVEYEDDDHQPWEEPDTTAPRTTTIFKGLFFVVDLPYKYYGTLQIRPESSRSIFGSLERLIKQSVQSFFSSSKRVYFNTHPNFERHFEVFSSHPDQARKILHHELLDNIFNLYKNWRIPLYINIIGARAYIGLPSRSNYFEMNQKQPKEIILKQLYHQLVSCFAVVEALSIPHPNPK